MTIYLKKIVLALILNCFLCPTKDQLGNVITSIPGFKCGYFQVPLDYQHPNQGRTSLFMTLHKATGTKLGTIIYNFGGPWNDNVTYLRSIGGNLPPADILAHYDVATFLNRGVSDGTQFTCHTNNPEQLKFVEEQIAQINISTPANTDKLYQLSKEKAALCQYPNIIHYADTHQTVNDLEEFRKALNIKQFDYYGGSYGTRLGLAYMMTYPNSMRNAVLDGNMAPNNDAMVVFNDWAATNEQTIKFLFQSCVDAKSQCPLYDPTAGLSTAQEMQNAYLNLLQTLSANDNDTHKINAGELNALTFQIVSDNATYPTLMTALKPAIVNHQFAELTKAYSAAMSYDFKSGTYAANFWPIYQTALEVPSTVFPADYTNYRQLADEQNWQDFISEKLAAYPLLGGYMAATQASLYIAPPAKSNPLLPADGGKLPEFKGQVLLLGNRYDPRTPYPWTQQVYQLLQKNHITSSLTTWTGAGHEAYQINTPDGGCADTTVNDFFISKTLPPSKTCTDGTNPFLNTTNKALLSSKSVQSNIMNVKK